MAEQVQRTLRVCCSLFWVQSELKRFKTPQENLFPPHPQETPQQSLQWQLFPSVPSKPLRVKRGGHSQGSREAAGGRSSRLQKLRDGNIPWNTCRAAGTGVALDRGELSWVGGRGYPRPEKVWWLFCSKCSWWEYQGEGATWKHRLGHSVIH